MQQIARPGQRTSALKAKLSYGPTRAPVQGSDRHAVLATTRPTYSFGALEVGLLWVCKTVETHMLSMIW